MVGRFFGGGKEVLYEEELNSAAMWGKFGIYRVWHHNYLFTKGNKTSFINPEIFFFHNDNTHLKFCFTQF